MLLAKTPRAGLCNVFQCSNCLIHLQRLRENSSGPVRNYNLQGDRGLIECSDAAREEGIKNFAVIPDFISQEEEQSLLQDISRTLRGKRYQYDHWDGVSESVNYAGWLG